MINSTNRKVIYQTINDVFCRVEKRHNYYRKMKRIVAFLYNNPFSEMVLFETSIITTILLFFLDRVLLLSYRIQHLFLTYMDEHRRLVISQALRRIR